ncbi:MAG: DUF6263 family protein, partial [Phycisphaerales bacterium]
MNSSTIVRPLTAAVLLACAGVWTTPVSGATQPPAASTSESAVTLKPAFKPGDQFRYRIVIDRTDANIVPAAMMSPTPAPEKPEAKPSDDAPKSDPAVTDGAPDRTKEPGEAAAPAAKPAAEPPASESITASSRVVLDTVQVLTVKDVGEGGIRMELTIESVKADITMPEREARYDSTVAEDDRDKDNLGLQTFRPIIGLTMELAADRDGYITEVKGNEPYLNAGSPAMSGYLQGLTGADNIRINWNMLLHAKKGGGEFKVGDTWANEEAFAVKQMNARFELVRNSTLRSVAGDAVSVDSTGTMRLVSTDPERKPPFELKNGNLLQTATWSAKDGLVKRSEFFRSFQLDGSAQGFPL